MEALSKSQIFGGGWWSTGTHYMYFWRARGGGWGGQDALYKCAYKGGGGALRRLRSRGGVGGLGF